jgi:N-acyl-D-aspartate/D-glutamate deacylase
MLAAFASSNAGKAFARIEERWGRDPAAALEPIDDVLAHNLRAALLVTLAEDEPDDDHQDAVEATKAAGEKIRALANG